MTPPAPLSRSIPADVDTPPTLDMRTIAQLRAMPGGNAILAELRNLLLDEAADGLRDTRAAVAAGDAVALARIAHTLMGSSAAMGAAAFAHLWGAAEQHGLNGATAEAAALLDALEAERQRVRAALDGLLEG